MTKIKRLLSVVLCMALMAALVQPGTADALTAKNRKAHKAYRAYMKECRKKQGSIGFSADGSGKLDYAYADFDGDKVDELITFPGFGYMYQAIYTYRNGEVVSIASSGQGAFDYYYKDTGILFSSGNGNMGVYYDTYEKMVNGKFETIAEAQERWIDKDYNDLKKPVYKYYIKNKKVSKAKYKKYVKKLEKGKVFKFGSIKWKKF